MSTADLPESEVLPADAREAYRARLTAGIPWWYSPHAHLAAPTLVGVAMVAWATTVVHGISVSKVAVVVGTFVLSNALEWRAHKDLLHVRIRGFELPYDRHTVLHHGLYREHDMAVRSTKEWRFVLIPPWGILLILLPTAPITALLWGMGYPEHAALFVATCAVYVVSYEWAHLSYHLAPDSAIGRLAVVRWLRRHHAAHHDPRRMKKWNFNVNIPLWDWVRGTYWRGEAD